MCGLPAVCDASGPPPVITVQPQSQSVLLLGTATFYVTASSQTRMSYQWYFDGSPIFGANRDSYTVLSVLGLDTGTYYVKVSNDGGSVISSNATLNLATTSPGITTPPQDQTVTQGQNASFTVLASGSTPLAYQWNFNGSAISGSTSALLTLTNVQADQAGSYTVTVSNILGTITSHAANLTVDVPAGIATQPQSQVVMQGGDVSFSVVATGTASPDYTWYFNGSILAGAGDSPSITLTNVQTTNAGNYLVVVQNNWGAITSSVATLTVVTVAGIITPPQSQTVQAGQNAAFNVIASNTAPLSYAWNFDGAPLPGATNSTLMLTNVSSLLAGSYTVTVSDLAGSVTSPVATLTVDTPPPILSVNSGLGIGSSGFTLQLTVPAGQTYVIMASTNLQNWTPIETNISASGSAVFTDSEATNYPVRIYRAVVW
jgi:hypothetical protein